MAPPSEEGKQSGRGGRGEESAATWPPNFPHREIDALVDQLERGQSLDRSDAFLLLSRVAKEAQRLRTTTVGLSAARLAEADREARDIIARAKEDADALRAHGLSALNSRLDEAERLLSTLRATFVVEHRSADLARADDDARRRRHNREGQGS